MSKITNCILMLELLQNRKVYSIKELSEELAVSERMIRYYKEQLELAGYDIKSFKGPGGGYFINKKETFNLNYFNIYDLEVLDYIEKVISDNNMIDNRLLKKFSLLNKKLHNTYNANKVLSEFKELDVSIKDGDTKFDDITTCVNKKKELLISYMRVDGVLTKRKILPLCFFEFENTIYITAYCKLRGDIRQFALDRIISYEME